MVLEFLIKSAIGHPTTPKGGTPEYRNGPWYKKVNGKKQGDRMGRKRAFGAGAYADTRTRFVTIEQKWSRLKMWFDDRLKDSMFANPARNARIEKVMSVMVRKCGRKRYHSPELMCDKYVRAAFECVDWDDAEEVSTLFYIAKNLVQGRRAEDELWLDWSDVKMTEASESTKAGMVCSAHSIGCPYARQGA